MSTRVVIDVNYDTEPVSGTTPPPSGRRSRRSRASTTSASSCSSGSGEEDDRARHATDPRAPRDISDTGAGLYACKASVDMFGFTKDDFIEQIEDIITVGEFCEKAAGGQIILT